MLSQFVKQLRFREISHLILCQKTEKTGTTKALLVENYFYFKRNSLRKKIPATEKISCKETIMKSF